MIFQQTFSHFQVGAPLRFDDCAQPHQPSRFVCLYIKWHWHLCTCAAHMYTHVAATFDTTRWLSLSILGYLVVYEDLWIRLTDDYSTTDPPTDLPGTMMTDIEWKCGRIFIKWLRLLHFTGQQFNRYIAICFCTANGLGSIPTLSLCAICTCKRVNESSAQRIVTSTTC